MLNTINSAWLKIKYFLKKGMHAEGSRCASHTGWLTLGSIITWLVYIGFSRSLTPIGKAVVRQRGVLMLLRQGKVGSTTLASSLVVFSIKAKIPYMVTEGIPIPSYNYPNPVVLTPYLFIDLLSFWPIVREQCTFPYKGDGNNLPLLRVIVPVRDPITHTISRYFQNIESLAKHDCNVSTIEQILLLDNGQLWGSFLKFCISKEVIRLAPSTWFENTVCPNLGFSPKEIFDTFDPSIGYAHYQRGHVRMLVYRFDIADLEKQHQIQILLDSNDFVLDTKWMNVGSEKPYADLYARFKRDFRFPPDAMRRMIDNDFFRTFYTPDEQQKIISRWQQ